MRRNPNLGTRPDPACVGPQPRPSHSAMLVASSKSWQNLELDCDSEAWPTAPHKETRTYHRQNVPHQDAPQACCAVVSFRRSRSAASMFRRLQRSRRTPSAPRSNRITMHNQIAMYTVRAEKRRATAWARVRPLDGGMRIVVPKTGRDEHRPMHLTQIHTNTQYQVDKLNKPANSCADRNSCWTPRTESPTASIDARAQHGDKSNGCKCMPSVR